MQWSIELVLFAGVGSANGAGLALQWEPEKVSLLLQKQGTSVSWEDECFTLLHFIRVRILYPDVSWCIRGIFLATLQLWIDLWRHSKQVFSWWQCLSLPCWDLSELSLGEFTTHILVTRGSTPWWFSCPLAALLCRLGFYWILVVCKFWQDCMHATTEWHIYH